MGIIKKLVALILFGATGLLAQQPQAPTGTPIYNVNAAFANGVAPGYWPTKGSGLVLNIAAGTVNCSSTMRTYAGGTLTMANNTTNYVYLDTTALCAPASNTSGFTSATIPLATVTTVSGAITAIVDDRTIQETVAAGGIPSPPSAIDGVSYNLTEIPSGGVTPLQWLPGGLGARTNTGTTDTLLGTDRTNSVIQSNAGAGTIAIPTAGGTGFLNHYVTALQNLGAGTATYTPASGTVDGVSNFSLLQGELAVLESPDDINYKTRRYSPPVRCSGGIICTPGPFSVTVSAAGGVGSHGLSFTMGDPAGSALGTGSTVTDYLTVPFACTIHAYNLVIDGGTITVKFWKVATGTAIPTSGNSISTSGVGISSGTAIHSTTLSDFTTTAVSANDILAMNVTAAATAKYVNGVLECD